MTDIEIYLADLDRALLTRGRRRRRAVAECRDHLTDAAAAGGEAEAVRRFGAATEVASAFDAETAVRRASRSTVATVAAVAAVAAILAVAGSTLALLNASDARGAVTLWAVVFFGAAQTSAVSTLLAVLLVAAALRRSRAVPAELRLLGRRNAVAVGFALLTEFAAGAAVPGHGSMSALLAGPVLAAFALAVVLRACCSRAGSTSTVHVWSMRR
ncbi:MAG: HAAS signaling domain-containing protein [Jatrophihabitans sp.]